MFEISAHLTPENAVASGDTVDAQTDAHRSASNYDANTTNA
jgi:hypothetical protein